ncbi:T9SS type A sorting domain-containing protein [Chryseobacterium sp. MP_3.2]|uniref:T9SS type A sorting domain-containing protein n=1 Tax=Chryseobacterium sp. MP_3.2 TaxID=3071712 RepID=UPI002DFEE2E3|nr:photosystem II stability/assembly factor-like uncharacterized protein [Chryseobacterium sp. MP_3.2]
MKKLLLTSCVLVAMATQAQSWVPQGTKFPTNFGTDEIVITDANTAWTFAYDGSGGGTYPQIVSRTTNGGTTWTTANITGPGTNALISDLAAVNSTTAWVITAPSEAGPLANKIYKTTDGGTSWASQTVGFTAPSFGNQIYFWDANEGWACGDPLGGSYEMYKTMNGGTTWTVVANRPASIGDYSYVGLKEVVGNTIWFGSDIGRIFRSSDRGLNWTSYFSPVTDFGGVTTSGSSGVMAFKDTSNGLLIAVDGAGAVGTTSAVLYSTTDGGASWDPVTTTGTWYFGDITHVPGTANTYVSTGINSGAPNFMGSSYSTDGGLTWTSIDAGVQRGKVQFLNPTTGWAGQFSNGTTGTTGILKFNGNFLATGENAVKSGLKIYPNPAVDVVNVTAKQPIKAISIFDMTGKKLQSSKSTSQVNVSSLVKGTYILQVFYGDGAVENTKLIKK